MTRSGLIRSLISVILLVFMNCEMKEHNICSRVDMKNSSIKLNLTTPISYEECCCNVQIITHSNNPTISIFVEYDCNIHFTRSYYWLNIRPCNATGTWENDSVDKDMDICVIRNGSLASTTRNTLQLKERPGGHSYEFVLSCNGSGNSYSSADTVTTAKSVMATNATGKQETTTYEQQPKQSLPVAAVAGIVVAGVLCIVAVAVVLFLLHAKRKRKTPQSDDVGRDGIRERHKSDVMRENSLNVPSGADNSGYYHTVQ